MCNSEQLHCYRILALPSFGWHQCSAGRHFGFFKHRCHDARKPQRMMETAEPGAFSFSSRWMINYFLSYFPSFLDEYTQPSNKTVVSALYG